MKDYHWALKRIDHYKKNAKVLRKLANNLTSILKKELNLQNEHQKSLVILGT